MPPSARHFRRPRVLCAWGAQGRLGYTAVFGGLLSVHKWYYVVAMLSAVFELLSGLDQLSILRQLQGAPLLSTAHLGAMNS